MMKQTRCCGCDKPIEPEWLPVGEFIVCDECSSDTDEKTVEKLQERLNTAKKYIEHVIGTIKHDGHLGTIQTDWILPDLEKALSAIGGDDETEFTEKTRKQQESFVRAWINDYTVAKEKRYEVVFLEDDTTRQILMENNAGYYFIEEESENYGYWKQDFTEMEIKEINEKFWQLSVPVKDEQIEVEE